MGGRGSKSGFGKTAGSQKKKFSFNVDSLNGSEKQKKWAQDIVDQAFHAINANISLNLTREKETQIPYFKEYAEIYREVGNQIKERLSTVKNAAEIIDIREQLHDKRIRQFVSHKYERKHR